MADKAINQYQTKTTLDSDVVFPVGRSYTTYKAPFDRMKESLADGLVMAEQGRSNAGKTLAIGEDGAVILKRM